MRFWQKRQRTPDDDEIFLRDQGMVQLCRGLGLPDQLITKSTTVFCVPACFFEVYSNGHISIPHPPFDSAQFGTLDVQQLVAWFGAHQFADGLFGQRLAEVRDGKRHLNGVDMRKLQRIFAELLVLNLMDGAGPLGTVDKTKAFPPLIRIGGDGLYLGGNFDQREKSAPDELLRRTPIRHVLDLAPGPRAIHQLDQILGLAMLNPSALYQYSTINRNAFQNHLLLDYVRQMSTNLTGSNDLAVTLAQNEVVVLIEGGLAAFTQQLIGNREHKGMQPAFLDLAIYVSDQPPLIDAAEAGTLLHNLSRLLAPNGMLVIGFPLGANTPGNISFSDLMRLAMLTGFIDVRIHTGMPQDRLPTYQVCIKESM